MNDVPLRQKPRIFSLTGFVMYAILFFLGQVIVWFTTPIERRHLHFWPGTIASSLMFGTFMSVGNGLLRRREANKKSKTQSS